VPSRLFVLLSATDTTQADSEKLALMAVRMARTTQDEKDFIQHFPKWRDLFLQTKQKFDQFCSQLDQDFRELCLKLQGNTDKEFALLVEKQLWNKVFFAMRKQATTAKQHLSTPSSLLDMFGTRLLEQHLQSI
jgi:hypothetical protein